MFYWLFFFLENINKQFLGGCILIILASESPRRQELLKQIGCEFYCVPSAVMENNGEGIPPEQLVINNALAKAKDVVKRENIVLPVVAADTIVSFAGHVYGKPVDQEDAFRILNALIGNTHQVYTGIVLAKGEEIWYDVVKTNVTFCLLTDAEIKDYIATGEPMGKAGAYAIQGYAAAFVKQLEGSYSNVVGLPLYNLLKLAKRAGLDLR